MAEMTSVERAMLVTAIAEREGTARELADRYGYSVAFLRKFAKENQEAIQLASEAIKEASEGATEPTPGQLSSLWIANKIERLYRYEQIANKLYNEALHGGADSTVLREFRAYLRAAAEELGQLLHRGSGEAETGDYVSYEIPGVDLGSLQ